MPSTRARSYLVIYGVVIRFWLACGRSPEGRISTFSWPSWTPRQKRWKVSGDDDDNDDNHHYYYRLLRVRAHAAAVHLVLTITLHGRGDSAHFRGSEWELTWPKSPT